MPGSVDDNASMFGASSSAQVSRTADSGAGAVALMPALVAGVMWLMAVLVTGGWLLQVVGRQTLVPVNAVPQEPVQSDVAALARALGANAEAPAGPSTPPPVRLQLLGFVAQSGKRGAALIAIEGQPPRPVMVGATVHGSMRLLSVGPRAVRVGVSPDDPAAVELSLPPPTE